MRIFANFARVYALSIIDYFNGEMVILCLDAHFDQIGMGMLLNIGQRLLHDAIELQLDKIIEAIVFAAVTIYEVTVQMFLSGQYRQ